MQSRGALLVMEVEQLDQWQSSASELKCGRLSMLADWSLALQSGPTCSAPVCPERPVPLSLLGPRISIRHQLHSLRDDLTMTPVQLRSTLSVGPGPTMV